MDIKEATKLAIEALEIRAWETYEGDELDDPDIKLFVAKQEAAMKVLKSTLWEILSGIKYLHLGLGLK